jgi:hypothetical protein
MTTEQKQLILRVALALNETDACTAEDIHQLLPTVPITDIGHVLAILALEDVGYRRGHHPEKVLARIVSILLGEPVDEPDGADMYGDDRT